MEERNAGPNLRLGDLEPIDVPEKYTELAHI
jgi:hypothetical protein